jgi:hypothetical protein
VTVKRLKAVSVFAVSLLSLRASSRIRRRSRSSCSGASMSLTFLHYATLAVSEAISRAFVLDRPLRITGSGTNNVATQPKAPNDSNTFHDQLRWSSPNQEQSQGIDEGHASWY